MCQYRVAAVMVVVLLIYQPCVEVPTVHVLTIVDQSIGAVNHYLMVTDESPRMGMKRLSLSTSMSKWHFG
jgi:hypothetical protein